MLLLALSLLKLPSSFGARRLLPCSSPQNPPRGLRSMMYPLPKEDKMPDHSLRKLHQRHEEKPSSLSFERRMDLH